MNQLDIAIKTAIRRYGKADCIWAYEQNADGNGPGYISSCLNMTTAQANAAINAGRWLAKNPNATV